MRYLKQKIARARESRRLLQSSGLLKKRPEPQPTPEFQPKIETPAEVETLKTNVKKNKPKRSNGNNVMKNYASAMANFALSRMAEPYLSESPLVSRMPLQLFRKMLVLKKKKINCIKRLRELWVIDKTQDSEEMKTFKGLFKEACKVFLKYFWVNWVYNSKLDDKSKYLTYRGRLLRRVENPQWFTYLEIIDTNKPEKQKPRSSNNMKKELSE